MEAYPCGIDNLRAGAGPNTGSQASCGSDPNADSVSDEALLRLGASLAAGELEREMGKSRDENSERGVTDS